MLDEKGWKPLDKPDVKVNRQLAKGLWQRGRRRDEVSKISEELPEKNNSGLIFGTNLNRVPVSEVEGNPTISPEELASYLNETRQFAVRTGELITRSMPLYVYDSQSFQDVLANTCNNNGIDASSVIFRNIGFDKSGLLNPLYGAFVSETDSEGKITGYIKILTVTDEKRSPEPIRPLPDHLPFDAQPQVQSEVDIAWEGAQKNAEIIAARNLPLPGKYPEKSLMELEREHENEQRETLTQSVEGNPESSQEDHEVDRDGVTLELQTLAREPIDERFMLEHTIDGQLDYAVGAHVVTKELALFTATVFHARYDLLAREIQLKFPSEEGTQDDLDVIDSLMRAHDILSEELEKIHEDNAKNLSEAQEFWGLTKPVLDKVLPSEGNEIAQLGKIAGFVGDHAQDHLLRVLVDKTNDVVAARLVEILGRPLKDDEMQSLIPAARQKGRLGKLLPFLASRNAEDPLRVFGLKLADIADRKKLLQDVCTEVREIAMPDLNRPDDPMTLVIEGPLVPTEAEINTNGMRTMSQSVEALNRILEKYHVDIALEDTDKQRLITRIVSILQRRMYTPGSEGKNLIDASDEMLKEVDQTLFLREEVKAA